MAESIDDTRLDSDELMAEVERFLRDQGGRARSVPPEPSGSTAPRHIGERGASNAVVQLLAVDRGERHRPPPVRAGDTAMAARRGRTSRRRRSPADDRQVAAGRRAVEQQHVHREAGETHALAVDDRRAPAPARTRCRSPRATSLTATSAGE